MEPSLLHAILGLKAPQGQGKQRMNKIEGQKGPGEIQTGTKGKPV
jgi:hypothetical protein